MSRLATPSIPPFVPVSAGRPGYIPPKGTLARLRERRRVRAIARGLRDGKWRETLVDAGRTQHFFRRALRGADDAKSASVVDTGVLIEHVNTVRLVAQMHASIVCGEPVRIGVPEEFAAQAAALDRIRAASLLDARLLEAADIVHVEGECAVRVERGEAGATISIDDNDLALPVGPDGIDGQPTVWERRWIVERPGQRAGDAGGRPRRYIRVERHGAGYVDQEAYRAKNDGLETHEDLETLTRATLAEALGDGGTGGTPVPPERTLTGVAHPLIVQLARERVRGVLTGLFPEGDLSLMDSTMAGLSQVSRARDLHLSPKMRVPSGAINPRTGTADVGEVFEDPNKQAEYLHLDLKLSEGLQAVYAVLRLALVQARMSPALLGLKSGEGAAPATLGQLRLESTNTLTAARQTATYLNPAIGRLLTIACLVDSSIGLNGYDVAPVTATLTPELPRSFLDRVEEQERALAAGVTSRRRAVAAIHGEAQADAVAAEIEADEEARSKRQAAASFGAAGM